MNTDKHTDNHADSVDFISKWKREKGTNKPAMKGALPIRTLILILVLLLICMYLLEKKIN